MKTICSVLLILGYVNVGYSFTKYGRSCKDIGCPSNQQCVMETDPCSYYQRQGECGSYPTCKKMSGGSARTCTNFICPPSQICKMDGANPRCVDDHAKQGLAIYDTQSANAPLDPGTAGNQPSAPNGGSIYPSIPKGETTPRPNINRPAGQPGGGYQGGQIGSGYPGQASGYPQQNGGYPQQGYQGQGYPQGGYQGYPQGGYQQGGYQQGGYQQGNNYQQYPGYNPGYQNPYQQNNYGQKSTGSSITDKLTQGLKSLGTNLLKNYLNKALSGNNN